MRMCVFAPCSCSSTFNFEAALNVQTTEASVSPNATDLLSTAYQLAAIANRTVWLGAYRDPSSPATQGWSWVDGTNASNINYGTSGYGLWSAGEPK
jgi:hypothetical protein